MTKKILYVVTSGIDTPDRLYAPFVLSTTAKTMGIDATIYFLMRGVTVIKKGEAEKIQMGDFPPLKEVIDQAIDAGVELMACDQSTQVLGIERGGYVDACGIVGSATLNDLALEADAILTF
ncbi:MAG: DsrE family protein [Candidatus Odinarchaeota archaeon]